jgi:sortase B
MAKGIVIRIVICLICVVGIVFCLLNIIPDLRDYRASEQTYDALEEQVVSVAADEPEEAEPEPEPVQEEEIAEEAVEEPVTEEAPAEPSHGDDWWYREVSIDFETLQKQNREIVAWIRFDNKKQIAIDYPVTHTNNNDKYLHTDIYGKQRKAGTLFFEAGIQNPVSSGHMKDIIYGHMMKDGSMFAPLKKYVKDSSVYKNNQFFTVYKRGAAYRYRIFSYFITTNGSPVYEYGFTEPDDAYRAHLDYLESHSRVHDFEPDVRNPVLTLSTCSKSHSDERIVINAELIDTKVTG